MTLDELWRKHPEFLENPKGKVFLLLTKILDANMDLSIQVHPDDSYATANENGELGKSECWYIINCKDDATMIFGHNARTKEEIVEKIHVGKWNELLNRVKIKTGLNLHKNGYRIP